MVQQWHVWYVIGVFIGGWTGRGDWKFGVYLACCAALGVTIGLLIDLSVRWNYARKVANS